MTNPRFAPSALRKERLSRGLGHSALSRLAGVGRDTIRLAEAGTFVPRTETIYKLTVALGLEPLALYRSADETDLAEAS